MSAISEPLKKQRLVAIAITWAWFVVSACVGLNALIKSNQAQTHDRKLAPQGVTLEFHINDIYQPGVVLTSVCAAVAVILSKFFIVTLIWPKRSTNSLKIQAWILIFFNAWLLATQIPFTVFTATRSAKIDAFLDGQQLPAATVQAAIAAEGQSAKYNKLHSNVLLSVFPWIALLFNTMLISILFAAARRRVEPEKSLHSSFVETEKKNSHDG
ncbi:hypothetical protein EI94DRAFT_1586480 [Lactarius quietus]|nr:hypothetical protein EI94DRAFT_1586480 [Lactarius quietus]